MDELLALAEELADAAGSVIRRWFRQPVAVDDKPDTSPVTIADRDAEAAMRALIERRFPEHGIFGEEHGRVREDAEYLWLLDPIDGTKSFISGVPLFGTLIGLFRHGRPVLGVLDQPILKERWIGAAGRASTLNGRPIRTRACTALDKATLFSTSPDMFPDSAEREAFARVRRSVKLARYGGDCYAYGLLAAGFIDCVVESSLKPYDWGALVPIVEGAGGRLTDWEGQALGLASTGRVVACGDSALQPELLARLNAPAG